MKIWTKTSAAVLAVATIALVAVPAHAGYVVGTYVQNYSPLSGNRNFEGYNFTTDAFFNNFGPGNGGDFVYRACSGSTCEASSFGTPDHTGTATESFDFASMADTDQGGFSSGGGTAHAALATGKLGGSSEGSYRPVFGMDTGIVTRSFSTFGDTLHFLVAGADASTVTNITLNLIVHGSISRPNSIPVGAGISVGGRVNSFLVTSDGGQFNGAYGLQYDEVSPRIISASAPYWLSSTITPLSDGIAFSGVLGLRGTNPTLGIGEYLVLDCGGGVACDFSHTAAFTFDLPGNVSFTSDSGVFLTGLGGPGGVPEPASWALMIAGFGLTGAAMRRRAKVSVSYA